MIAANFTALDETCWQQKETAVGGGEEVGPTVTSSRFYRIDLW